ncbi:MAG: very short patch repair endonuclease [Acetobacteraceae bacterium]
MQANKGKNTKPEIALRSLVHALGYRFRIHDRSLPGTPDLAFSRRRKVIWSHGCWWHLHPGCRSVVIPKTRTEFWAQKLKRNRQRDVEHQVRLKEMGWDYLIIWECEMKDPAAVQKRVAEFLGPTRHLKLGKPS